MCAIIGIVKIAKRGHIKIKNRHSLAIQLYSAEMQITFAWANFQNYTYNDRKVDILTPVH